MHILYILGDSRGYSITATSTVDANVTARIYTDNEFMEPICLSLWYQLYGDCHDCSFSIYTMYDGYHSLLFTTETDSTSINQWENISVDVYEHVSFNLALEANFTDRKSNTVCSILVDDTSIAYRQCEGKYNLNLYQQKHEQKGTRNCPYNST